MKGKFIVEKPSADFFSHETLRLQQQTIERLKHEAEKLRAERDKWKDEYQNLCKFATDYENQVAELKAERNHYFNQVGNIIDDRQVIINREEVLLSLVKVMRQVLCENTCFDPCGFDPREESKETLVDCFINNDHAGQMAIERVDEILKLAGVGG